MQLVESLIQMITKLTHGVSNLTSGNAVLRLLIKNLQYLLDWPSRPSFQYNKKEQSASGSLASQSFA
jgi:hypothetical protein